MANQPIPVSTANEMIQLYISYMQNLGVDMNKQSQSVSFDGQIVMKWLTSVMPFADELQVCLGVYPQSEPNGGRITTILWPYKNGKPATEPIYGKGGDGDGKEINPFNKGTDNP